MRAMLVTAGFGTRLAPLTDLLPKPAVPVANRPAASFALDHMQRFGVREFVLNTHHLAAELEQAIRAAAPSGAALRFVHEPEILGTGGGIRNAWQPIDGETFLVANGKLLFAPDLAAALQLHRASGAIATMIVQPRPAGDPLGAIGIDSALRVRSLPGFSSPEASQLTPALYTGMCLLEARAHRDLPEQGCLIREGFARWLARGETVMAAVDHASFRDVGMSLWHYWEANQALLSGAVRWPGVVPDARGVIALGANVSSSAVVVQSAVGAGAHVADDVRLERCVVWPNARVMASLSDAIVLPGAEPIAVRRSEEG